MGSVIQLSTREVLILVSAFAGVVFTFGKLLLGQFERRMQERFDGMEKLRAAEKSALRDQFETLESNLEDTTGRVTAVVQRVEQLRDELPKQYVTREDWIRFATTQDAKLDRLMELVLSMKFNGGNKS
ncbi:hypothetical protein L2Y94_06570 [Luteibacter aegosomatis]|uniref:hypothetical protein n=1 Tax=Luteibacter aegosomatis TaxID=2911537 RepID=UPI001FF81707|nr:hypothetical protein [Luteibacter aegosomatis]UPG87015.1 hypothetical protein L2Y94_06570 [Luteibacter aegosomatis]